MQRVDGYYEARERNGEHRRKENRGGRILDIVVSIV
jgi:hypothetical protein